MKQKKYSKALAVATAFTLSVAMTGGAAATTVFADTLDSTQFSNQDGENPGGGTPGGENPGGGGTPGGGTPGGSGGGQSSSVSYTAVKEITSDTTLSDDTISSTGTDENAILIDSGTLTLNKMTINRTSSDSTGGDNASFYGVGASILNKGGTAIISDSTITSDAKGGAGVFSYSTGVSYVKDTTITTEQDTSGGIHVAGGGTLYAYDCDVTTSGGSSAAIRSDRGGGTMVVDGGTYTSNGSGSPAVYCTADITVNDADLVANGSEGVCIEGLNTLRLYDTSLTCNMPDDSQNDSSWGVILYQSQSGDSEEGCSTFTMDGGKIINKNGGLFYTTNTESSFVLNNVTITPSDDNDYFLMCTGNTNSRGWGSSGSNGADCTFTGIDQDMNGNIIWDSISELDLYLTEGSNLTGAVKDDETYAGSKTGSGYANVYISSDSTWTVTGDSTVSNLYNAGTIKDASGNTVTIKDSTGTVVSGTSSYTITVTGTYSNTADLSEAGSIDSYSKYQKDFPVSEEEEEECEHTYTSEITTEATCTTAGVKTYTCSKCGDTYTEKIAATGHSYTSEITTEATCTTAGVKTYTCSKCGDTYEEEIAATGHSYTSTIVKKATAKKDGKIKYTCKNCGAYKYKTIAAKNILSVSASNKTIKYSKVKKTAQTVKVVKGTSKISTTVTYKAVKYGKNAKKYLKLNIKTGKITVKRGTPKGTYTIKIKVTAKGNSKYAATSATKTVKITVK